MSKILICVADIGNTHTVVGLYKNKHLIQRWRVRTDRERTTDEWGLTLRSFFDLANTDLSKVAGMAICSVVPPALHALNRAGKKYFKTEPLIVGPGVKTGLIIRYDNPREVGTDRVVNAVAALDKVKKACIVVDFGTATTFDCLSPKGEYLGGAIAPGLKISLDALVTRASQLPRVEIITPSAAIGKSTVEAMQSGILYGYAAMVDGLVARLSTEMNTGDIAIIATGGLSNVVAAESKVIEIIDPDITLNGLRLIFEKNR